MRECEREITSLFSSDSLHPFVGWFDNVWLGGPSIALTLSRVCALHARFSLVFWYALVGCEGPRRAIENARFR